MTKIAMIPGDGVGPEVMAEASKLLETLRETYHLDLESATFDLGADYTLETGLALPEGIIDELKGGYKGILMGPLGDPRIHDDRHVKVIISGLIRHLDLYAGLRRIRVLSDDLFPLANKNAKAVDLALIWESRGGVHAGAGTVIEKGTTGEIVVEEQIETRKRVEQVIRFAFDYAMGNRRSKVTLVHRSRAYPYGRDLWIRTFQEVQEDYPDMAGSRMGLDAAIQQLMTAPETLDVIVTNHLLGSILSSLGTALQGGPGLVASSNLHPGQVGLFRPLHSASSKYAGKDYANPMAAMLSVQDLMEFLGKKRISRDIGRALKKALKSGWVTRDLGGSMGTREVADYVCSAISESKS
ncbi:MAG: isocitrate/isopropylmalate family dehydrogenase [Fidelibacterota bacterium]